MNLRTYLMIKSAAKVRKNTPIVNSEVAATVAEKQTIGELLAKLFGRIGGGVRSGAEKAWGGLKGGAEKAWGGIRSGAGKAWSGLKGGAGAAGRGIADFYGKHTNSINTGGGALAGALAGGAISDALGFDDDYNIGAGLGGAVGAAGGLKLPEIIKALKGIKL